MNNIKQAADQLILKYKTILVEEIETSQKILDITALKCAIADINSAIEYYDFLIKLMKEHSYFQGDNKTVILRTHDEMNELLNELKSRERNDD